MTMKKLATVITGCLLGASAWSVPVQWSASAGGNDHWYDVVYAPELPWASARIAALGMTYDGLQAHLATVTSQGELEFLDNQVVSMGFGEMYVGGYQNPENETDPQAGWTWVNGEGAFPGFTSSSPFANWNAGEPNDAYGPGSEQWLGINWQGGAFNDEGNLANIWGYIVEYDPTTFNDVPDSGTTVALLGGVLTLLGLASRRFRK
jgi:hypothetical protein